MAPDRTYPNFIFSATSGADATTEADNAGPAPTSSVAAQTSPVAVASPTSAVSIAAPTAVAVPAPTPASSVEAAVVARGEAVIPVPGRRRVAVVAVATRRVAVIPIGARCGVAVTCRAPTPPTPTERCGVCFQLQEEALRPPKRWLLLVTALITPFPAFPALKECQLSCSKTLGLNPKRTRT
jgi:hypothetical protein